MKTVRRVPKTGLHMNIANITLFPGKTVIFSTFFMGKNVIFPTFFTGENVKNNTLSAAALEMVPGTKI
jgi:hypothetical protein